MVLIGGGIMSATLGALLKRLDPEMGIRLFEVAGGFAREASDGWHNAGTGHAGICELSYTPDRGPDGEVDVAKAISIFAEFERSLHFWGSAAELGMTDDPTTFINPVPHVSFVHGEEGVDFLASRYRGLKDHHFFEEMEFTDDPETVRDWAPLLMTGREDKPVAATRMHGGSDVNFGALARQLIGWLGVQDGCSAACGQRVVDLDRQGGGWSVSVRDEATGSIQKTTARFVFVGAGGGSLKLLQKAGIPEVRGYGGFPIGGQWLVCDRPEIVSQHHAKVYGAALGASPTLAVPHLDTRIIDGRESLLFGPFGSWTTKFLHEGGSFLDMPGSVRPDNLWPLIKTGACNIPLVAYLVGQGIQSMSDRLDALRDFYPDARAGDWKLIDAGIRVQAIKSVDGDAGIVHFGTEVLSDESRSIAALLGASPGASVSTDVMLKLIESCFPDLLKDDPGTRLRDLIPVYDHDLTNPNNAPLFQKLKSKPRTALGLT